MTSRPRYPDVDERRAAGLRSALLRDIAAMAPFWRGPHEPAGADRALVEAAARLHEEATKRLDRTPERDALAFLDMLDIAPPQPVAAEGLVAVALKEERRAPVEVPARTGIEIATAEAKVPFETKVPIKVQPGRIGMLACIDPVFDRIEIAPEAVTSLEPDRSPRPTYQLATGAPADSLVLAIEPAVGLAPGDLLRIDFTKADGRPPSFHEVAALAEDGRVILSTPIGGAGLTRTAVLRISRQTALDAFAMPNQQKHAFYLGDPDVLNVKEPAELKLRLRFDPPQAAADLIGGGARFEIFGTRESPGPPDEVPRWHELVPLAATGADLVLYKGWTGPVDEVEVGALKARFIRIVPAGAITADSSPLMAGQAELLEIRIGVRTELPEAPGDDTISQIAHNGQPLSTAGSFLPFGAEPLRFDVFSLAATEAFTKPEARAVLDFEMADATMLAVTQAIRADGDRHLYGISRNGRLQVMDATTSTVFVELAGPTQDGDAGQKLALDPAGGVLAQGAVAQSGGESLDLVFARTSSGRWHVALIQLDREVTDQSDQRIERRGRWQPLPALPASALAEVEPGVVEEPALALAPDILLDGTTYRSHVIAATSLGFWRIEVTSSAAMSDSWTRLEAPDDAPLFQAPTSPVLVRVEDAAFLGENQGDPFARRSFLTVDVAGSVWLLSIGTEHPAVRFNALGLQAAPGSRPAGMFHDDGASLVVAAAADGSLEYRRLAYPGLNKLETEVLGDVPDQSALGFVPDLTPGAPPQVVAYLHAAGSARLVEWAPGVAAAAIAHTPVPGGVTASTDAALPLLALFPRREELAGDAEGRARAVIAGEDRTALVLEFNRSREVSLVADWIEIPEATSDLNLSTPVVWRVTTDGEVAVAFDIPIVGTRAKGTPVAELPDDDTNWIQDVFACRVEGDANEKSAELESATNRLSDPGGGDLELTEGELILVGNTGVVPNVFRLLEVAETISNDVVRLKQPTLLSGALAAEIDSLILGGTINVVWRRAALVFRIDATNRANFRRTLLRFAAPAPAFATAFEAPGRLAEVEALLGSDLAILKSWTAAPPATALFKYVASADAFQQLVQAPIAEGYSAPRLSWEYYNGEGWKRLDVTDTTNNLATTGALSFTVPRDLSVAEIGGQEDYWIRARLVGGDYGRPRYVVDTDGNEQTITVDTSHMRPPEVMRVRAAFTLEPDHLPAHLVARNNLQDIDVTEANGLAGATIAMFRGADAAPLTPVAETDAQAPGRAILVGFTQPLSVGSVALLVKAEDQRPSGPLEIHTLGPDAVWTPAPLTGEDATHGLTRSGLLSFQVATEPAQLQLLGRPLYWIRIAAAEGALAPRLHGLYLNGVAVIQATTVEQELLGSSLGEPGQEFQIQKPPVLAGSLELRVRERLGEEEVAALRAAASPEQPDPVLDKVKNLPGQWVLWQPVDSFADDDAARALRVNSAGLIRAGDGRSGRLIPAGRDSVRAFRYRSGGQRVATAAFAAAAVTGTVEALELLLAPIAISGGRDLPATEELVARMPEALRRAGTALTLADIESAARDADNEIVQVRAFAPSAVRDKVLVAVLARGEGRLTSYSRAARDNLTRLLSLAMSDAWGTDCLDVVSVDFVKLVVDLTLVAKPGRRAELEAEASRRLGRFLDPARGGPEGGGWPPGRPLWPTDLRRALTPIAALDRIEAIAISAKDGSRDPTVIGPAEVIAAAALRDIRIGVAEAAK